MNKTVQQVTTNIQLRSETTRQKYFDKITQTQLQHPPKVKLPCGNIAHSVAACSPTVKNSLIKQSNKNIAIVSAYNDMLSAHQPYIDYPELIKSHIIEIGGTAQFAGGVPAMCDGVTQGQPGMEISLFSRDVIAMSVGITAGLASSRLPVNTFNTSLSRTCANRYHTHTRTHTGRYTAHTHTHTHTISNNTYPLCSVRVCC